MRGSASIEETATMPVRPIVRLGHPALRTVARAIPPERIGEPEVQQLIDDLIESMREARGVGLAAPQVGEELQVFVLEAGEIPFKVVVNPMITPQERELVQDWEGCLSIPGLRGIVPRHPEVRVQGLDRAGNPLDYLAQGFEARIVQHEFDHLNGVVFLDRMRDLRSLSYLEEWQEFLDGKDDRDGTAVG
jgi:peptide deformylase